MPVSFAVTSKTTAQRSDPAPPILAFAAEAAAFPDSGAGAAQFVTEFDPAQTLAAAPAKPVLPPIENRWRPEMVMRHLIGPAAPAANGAGMEFEAVDPGANGADDSGMSFGLNLRRRVDGDDDGGEPARKRKTVESVLLDKCREDLRSLPEHRGMEEYGDIKVEDFGSAMLRGYGWEEGKGIGRKTNVDVKVFECVRHAGTQGLGFVAPAGLPPPGKKGRRDPAPATNDTSKPKSHSSNGSATAGRMVRVIDGRYAGLKGKVVRSLEGAKLVLELVNREEISVAENQVAELGSKDEERCLRKLKELKIREKEDASRSDHRRNESRKEDRKRGSERSVEKGRGREKDSISWLENNIRVRIISEKLRGGKLYLRKGMITDVVNPKTCVIIMDESREMIEGVSQDMLETVMPKRGGLVLVLSGERRGLLGKLVDKDVGRETAVVQDEDHQFVNVKLDQIAEYLGDPSLYLG